jgi:hypothetical protein
MCSRLQPMMHVSSEVAPGDKNGRHKVKERGECLHSLAKTIGQFTQLIGYYP